MSPNLLQFSAIELDMDRSLRTDAPIVGALISRSAFVRSLRAPMLYLPTVYARYPQCWLVSTVYFSRRTNETERVSEGWILSVVQTAG